MVKDGDEDTILLNYLWVSLPLLNRSTADLYNYCNANLNKIIKAPNDNIKLCCTYTPFP